MKKLQVLLVLAVIGLGFAFTVQSDIQWISVSGYVENVDGDALSQVDVKCYLGSDHSLQSSAVTEEDGYFTIRVQKSASSTLTFSRSGYVSHDESVLSSTDVEDMNVTLTKQPSN